MKKKNFGMLLLLLGLLFVMSPSYAGTIQYSENIVPIMTSNTTPSGRADASSVYYLAYGAFSQPGGWSPDANPSWVEYEFPKMKTVTKFRVESTIDDYYSVPQMLNFEAYNQSTQTWDILKSVNLTEPTQGYESAIDNTKPYLRYRLNIFKWFSDFDISITAFKMYETLDTIAPATICSINGTLGNNGTVSSNITYTLTANDGNDGSGVDKIEYSLNNITWQQYTQPIIITKASGANFLWFRASDNAGNIETAKKVNISIE